jgi:hypothetical protein
MAAVSPRPDADRLEALLARCAAGRALHMTSGPCGDDEVWDLERTLGAAIPEPFRTFLMRLGGGVFFMRHEIFGAHRVMVHDIELVPDILSFRNWLGTVPSMWIPVHREEEQVHVLELNTGRVRPLEGAGTIYPDFEDFLERVVLS